MTERPYYDAALQTMPREQLARLQSERLLRQLDRIWSVPVPFFQRKLAAAGIRRGDVRSLTDLTGIPTTIKAELRATKREGTAVRRLSRRDAYPSGPPRASTGTSGGRRILWTHKDLEVDNEAPPAAAALGAPSGMSSRTRSFGMNAAAGT